MPLYAPSAWVGGASIAHLADSYDSTANAANALMTNTFAFTKRHVPGPVTLGILTDIGWKSDFTAACNTVTPDNFFDPKYDGYGAPYDVFAKDKDMRAKHDMLVYANCSSNDTHTIQVTLGVPIPGKPLPGDTNHLVNTKGYYYNSSISTWKPYTAICNGTQNGDWCEGYATVTITDPNISTVSKATLTYVIGYTCSVQEGQWKCGCRDTACAGDPRWLIQGAWK